MASPQDINLFAVCIYDEARGEIDDGKFAVGRVLLNRAKLHFFSDGTVTGTVLRKDQFSGFWFQMVNGRYTRVCSTLDQAQALATKKIAAAANDPQHWQSCLSVAHQMLESCYTGDAIYRQLTDNTVLYANLAICSPNWATPDKFVCKIGHHSFFRS